MERVILVKVGLLYIDSFFKEDELEHINNLLDIEGVEFKAYDKGRQVTASVDELFPAITIAMDFLKSNGFFVSLGASAAWDGFKTTVKYVIGKLDGKKFYKVTPKKREEVTSVLSILISVNGNEMHFKLDGLRNSEEIDSALDKMLPVIEKQLAKDDTNQIYIANYDKELHDWAAKNFLEEVRKKSSL